MADDEAQAFQVGVSRSFTSIREWAESAERIKSKAASPDVVAARK
jgi:hypothetical protein